MADVKNSGPKPRRSNEEIVRAAAEYLRQHQAENQAKWDQWQKDYQEFASKKKAAESAPKANQNVAEDVKIASIDDVAASIAGKPELDMGKIAALPSGAQTMKTAPATQYAAATQNAVGASTAPLMYNVPDEVRERLAAESEARRDAELMEAYNKRQEQMAADQAIMEADKAQIEAWPEEDKNALDLYVTYISELPGAVTSGALASKASKAKMEYQKLVQKYGAETVRNLAETRSRVKNEDLTKQVQEYGTEAVKGKTGASILHSTATIPANLLGAISGPVGILSDVATRTGRYSTLDPNNLGNLPAAYSGAVRGQVAADISGDQYDEEGNKISDGGIVRQGLAYGYQGVMSLADSIARATFGGGAVGGAVLAASGSFSQAIGDASAAGATPTQAVLLGVATAGMEYLTEKIPMDEVFKVAKSGNTNVLKQMFKQAGVEITTEELSLFGTLAAEAAIMQEKSSYKQQIAEAMANGATYAEAKQMADNAIWEQVKETAIVSGISGGISGGGSAVVGNARNGNAQTDVQTPAQAEAATEAATAPAEQAQQAETTTQPQQTETVAEAPQMPKERQAAQDVADMLMGKEKPAQPEVAVQDESTSVNTDPDEHTPEEQRIINEYQDAVDNDLVDYVQLVKDNPGKKLPRYPLNPVSDQAAADIQRLTGIDVHGNKTEIEARMIEHILKDHGENGGTDRSMRDANDIGRIQYVIDNYDAIEHGGTSSAYVYQNKHGRNAKAQTVVMKKKVNGTYFVVEAVPDTQKKTLFVISAYMNKNGQKETAPSLSGDAEASRFTSDNATKSGTVFNNSVAENNAGVKGTGAAEQNFSGEGNDNTVGAKESQFKHEVKKSKIYTNTYANTPYEDIYDVGRSAMKDDPNVQTYDAITEAESLNEAEQRTQTGQDRYVEFKHLMNKSGWTGADNDTAMKLLVKFREEGKTDRVIELRRKQREMGTQAGQMVQSFAKYSRADATVAVLDAVDELDKLSIDQVDSRFWKNTQPAKEKGNKFDSFEDWKKGVTTSLLGIANDIENVPDGDTDGMRDIVRQLANLRHTTAWAGYSSELTKRTEVGLNKMDFATLKGVAKTQIAMIPHDYQKRNAGEIIKAIRVQNMLFTLTTKFKNDTGNISNGFMDAVSDSYAGRMADYVIGKFTGKRTVGNDLKYAKEYVQAAKDASDVAAAFVSLDVPMETDAKYIKGTRTFSPNRENVFLRLLSAYEKHMKYALEVSDKFYEGGATHVVRKSIEDLGSLSGLDKEQIRNVSENVGQRRTFKDPGYKVDKDGQPTNRRALARANVGLQRALNNIGTDEIGAGDLFIPFAAVSGEVKQVGADYSGVGFVSGLSEMISIVKDVRNGKEIDPYRQRSAATNFGRSLTGLGVTVAFAALAYAGAIKVHEDKENKERIKNQSQGLSGGQWNMDASLRWLQNYANTNSIEAANEAAAWVANDELVSFDFLEPFSTQMRMGYYLSQDQGIMQALVKGNVEALLDMPMMQTFSDLADLQQTFTEVSDGDMSGVYDAAGQLVGTVAGSAVPNWVRKANQVIDPYYRDTYSANPVEKAVKEVMAAIPGASKTLPKKYDTMGNVQRRYKEGDELAAAVDTMVTPWDVDTYNANPVYLEIDRLNEALKDKKVNVTPTQPKRTVTYTDSNGEKHENEQLTGKQYETLTRVYGETNFKIASALMENSNFQKLTDLEKAYTLDAVYEYATEQGKKAAIGKDYYSNAAAWIGRTKEDDLSAFITKGSAKFIDNTVDNVADRLARDLEVKQAAKDDLEASWQSFKSMDGKTQDKLLEAVAGDTARYLLARRDNVSTKSWMAVTDNIANLKPEKGEGEVSAYQKYEAITKTKNVSTSEVDALMRAYMPDYDPDNGKTQQTEIKYDYMRQVMKISPEKAIAALRIAGESGKKDQKKTKWRKLGLSQSQVDTLWNLLESNSEKEKIDVVAWSKSRKK